ncbi:MAG: signal recognition particle protein [Proteobacteria bacterium]|nr:signal recognition particle protein [Pseudomonadota bacterium]
MFEGINDRLNQVFRKLKGWGKLSESNIEETLREIRLAFLEADVHYQVVSDFLTQVKTRALGQEVIESLTPGQQFIKIVREEMIQILGGKGQPLDLGGSPPVGIMLVGLQGSGKTTTAAKLAHYLKKSKGRNPLLVAFDARRPAAEEQLEILAGRVGAGFYRAREEAAAGRADQVIPRIRERALTEGYDVVILDTAGRLHVDPELMAELAAVRDVLKPRETLLVVDAMVGQDSVRMVQNFSTGVGVSGIILSKLDGDARGGAALSIRAAAGIPIKFLGVGEKDDDLELFHPERLADRILGMGDLLSLIEKAESVWEEKEVQKVQKKLASGGLDLEDFLEQFRMLKRMGSFESVLAMVPGMKKLAPNPEEMQRAEKEISRFEAIINSMTRNERRNPVLINGSRRRRIAAGSGTSPADVNRLLKRFQEMKKILKVKPGHRPGRMAFPFQNGFNI